MIGKHYNSQIQEQIAVAWAFSSFIENIELK